MLFDPLDGSSNLDVCGGVGTIFSILRQDRRSARRRGLRCCSPARKQVAAGYVLYGPSTVFVLTIGRGVDMFVLDPAYRRVHARGAAACKIPTREQELLGERRQSPARFPEGYQRYLDWAQEQTATRAATSGAMVADVHRILLKGGVFLYPPTEEGAERQAAPDVRSEPDGHARSSRRAARRSRLPAQRILDVQPTDIHQRTPVILGSPDEVDQVVRHLA